MKRLVFLISLAFVTFVPQALALDDTGTVVIPTPTPVVEYSLPYPGILPDNPLYPLKMARDKIILFLITDPKKKVEFNLLQADKRLEAAVFLINENKNKNELAVSTLAKGENYFHDAVQQVIELKKEGRDVNDLLSTLDTAAIKHISIEENLKKTLPGESPNLDTVITRMKAYQLQLHNAEK